MKDVNWDKYTFRCHILGYLMTEPKGKSIKQKYEEAIASRAAKQTKYDDLKNKETKTANDLFDSILALETKENQLKPFIDVPNLSQTCKTKLAEIYTTETTGRTKDIKAKYFEKGIMMEEDAITDYSLRTGEMHVKNTIRKRNDYIEGEMDFENGDTSIDTKVSWDVFTFDANAFKVINPIYHWQGDGYMDLFEKNKHKVAYVLLNTPANLYAAEERKLHYEFFGQGTIPSNIGLIELEMFELAKKDLYNKHHYDDLPLERRVRIFEIKKDQSRIERVYNRIIECRKYLNNFTNIENQQNGNSDDGAEGDMDD